MESEAVLRVFAILRSIELSITLDSNPNSVHHQTLSPNISQGVFITDQLFIPRYIWHKMHCDLPMIKEKIQYFIEIKDTLQQLRILYNKDVAKIMHIARLTKVLNEFKLKIGQHLFENPNM